MMVLYTLLKILCICIGVCLLGVIFCYPLFLDYVERQEKDNRNNE